MEKGIERDGKGKGMEAMDRQKAHRPDGKTGLREERERWWVKLYKSKGNCFDSNEKKIKC